LQARLRQIFENLFLSATNSQSLQIKIKETIQAFHDTLLPSSTHRCNRLSPIQIESKLQKCQKTSKNNRKIRKLQKILEKIPNIRLLYPNTATVLHLGFDNITV